MYPYLLFNEHCGAFYTFNSVNDIFHLNDKIVSFYKSGLVGGTLSLSALDSYATVNPSTDFDIGLSDFSMALWLKRPIYSTSYEIYFYNYDFNVDPSKGFMLFSEDNYIALWTNQNY